MTCCNPLNPSTCSCQSMFTRFNLWYHKEAGLYTLIITYVILRIQTSFRLTAIFIQFAIKKCTVAMRTNTPFILNHMNKTYTVTTAADFNVTCFRRLIFYSLVLLIIWVIPIVFKQDPVCMQHMSCLNVTMCWIIYIYFPHIGFKWKLHSSKGCFFQSGVRGVHIDVYVSVRCCTANLKCTFKEWAKMWALYKSCCTEVDHFPICFFSYFPDSSNT